MDPEQLRRFEFAGRELDPATGRVELHYRLSGRSGVIEFCERFEFGPVEFSAPPASVDAALDLLHWLAGVSYWKVACSGDVAFAARSPTPRQAEVLETTYRGGLAELAWRNGLRGRYWPDFGVGGAGPVPPAGAAALPERVLVPMGGGKDSLVALERVRRAGIEPVTVQVGSAGLIGRVAGRAGTRHRVIGRRLDPALADLNAAGAINGHVPITAINAAALVVAAVLWGFGAVVFGNERSADSPTLITADGAPVNHQFAKSLEFESMFAEWVHDRVAADLDVFSILRRDSELAVCREFAGLTRYHDVFSSCNRNFHLDGARTGRWCGACPKCRFVFLGLAPFIEPGALRGVFGRDLLDEPAQLPGFSELLALDGPRPFECVGEAGEARAAIAELALRPAWRGHAVVAALVGRLDRVEVPSFAGLLAPGGPDLIPARFLG